MARLSDSALLSQGEVQMEVPDSSSQCGCPRYTCRKCLVDTHTQSHVTLCEIFVSLIMRNGACVSVCVFVCLCVCLCVRCVEKKEVCVFQGVTVLGPGQSLVQSYEGELCYTVNCLTHKDSQTGFYAMDISFVNCSQKCEIGRASCRERV